MEGVIKLLKPQSAFFSQEREGNHEGPLLLLVFALGRRRVGGGEGGNGAREEEEEKFRRCAEKFSGERKREREIGSRYPPCFALPTCMITYVLVLYYILP